MEAIREPTLAAFVFQAVLLVLHIPVSYLAYRWARAPMKRQRNQQDLAQLGIVASAALDEDDPHQFKNYFWPLLGASALTLGLYTMTHPYSIQHGWWAGFLEEVTNIFGADVAFPRDILFGRFLFYGWLGAIVYSFHLTFRHFLTYDLTPSVYVFTSNRFLLALARAVGGGGHELRHVLDRDGDEF